MYQVSIVTKNRKKWKDHISKMTEEILFKAVSHIISEIFWCVLIKMD